MFEGFSPETIDFLWGLRMNNNREWFTEHKTQYTEKLYEPMKALAREISEPFAQIPGMVCKTSRIYRDMRMNPPTPYKESLWTCIRRDETWWMQEPSLFFEIRPDGVSYGFLFWQPTVPMMNAARADMGQRPDNYLKIVRKAERESGLSVTGTAYVKKRPCPDARLEPYFQLKNVMAIREEPVSEKLFVPELAVTVRQTLESLWPLCRYYQKFTNAKAEAPKKEE